MARRHFKAPESWSQILDRLRERRGEWQFCTDFGTYETVAYLRSIGARTMSDPWGLAANGAWLETVWAMIPVDDPPSHPS
jgi:hypothetical protein